ncbi:MAG: hypothetical protein Ta2A_11130 [Treponemataceae bacterium]|nr:MAG: hypothetical protein Ta2A_11130 [Treponemataceae bacterium]
MSVLKEGIKPCVFCAHFERTGFSKGWCVKTYKETTYWDGIRCADYIKRTEGDFDGECDTNTVK